MKKMLQLGLLTSVVLVCGIKVAAQKPHAIVEDPKGHPYVRVSTGKYEPVTQPVGSLYYVNDDNEQIQVTADLVPCIPGSAGMEGCLSGEFVLRFPSVESKLYDPTKSYAISLTVPVKMKEKDKDEVETIILSIGVVPRIGAELERNVNKCPDGISLLLRHHQPPYDWTAVTNWLAEFKDKPNGLATVELRIKGQAVEHWFDSPTDHFIFTPANDLASICFVPRKPLPSKDFAARVTLHGTRLPAELEAQVSADELSGPVVAAADDTLERNLDINGTLTSSVKNEEVAGTGGAPATMVRKRTTRGAIDMKFVPISDVLHPIIDDSKWMHFFTPLVIDAKVATGRIVDDTLSANRILIGLEGEARYRKVKVAPQTGDITRVVTHRVIYGFTHASDRDFRQDEFTGKIEYKPVFWKFNRPLNLNQTLNTFNERVQGGHFGYSFLPIVGFEIGRTYHRRNPAAAIKPSDTVRRLYFGLDAGLDVTSHLTFSLSDSFYIRGETPEHRQRNYFKGQLEAPLGRVFKNTVHSFVFSFERGDLAPFSSPSVNALKFGYRLQTNYCSPYCR